MAPNGYTCRAWVRLADTIMIRAQLLMDDLRNALGDEHSLVDHADSLCHMAEDLGDYLAAYAKRTNNDRLASKGSNNVR